MKRLKRGQRESSARDARRSAFEGPILVFWERNTFGGCARESVSASVDSEHSEDRLTAQLEGEEGVKSTKGHERALAPSCALHLDLFPARKWSEGGKILEERVWMASNRLTSHKTRRAAWR